jgi:hypothetical protein
MTTVVSAIFAFHMKYLTRIGFYLYSCGALSGHLLGKHSGVMNIAVLTACDANFGGELDSKDWD